VFNTAEYIVSLSRFYGLGAQNPNCASYRAMPKRTKTQERLDVLKGWQQIATFLGQPRSVAQRWAKSGMPVTREGRSLHASPEELNRWLGRESAGEPVQIPIPTKLKVAPLEGDEFSTAQPRAHCHQQ
jgi:hypothetical protein